MKLIKWDEVLVNYFDKVAIASGKEIADVAADIKVAIRDGKVLFVYSDGKEDLITLERDCDFKDLAAIKSSAAKIAKDLDGYRIGM
jgi:hypothetical protein